MIIETIEFDAAGNRIGSEFSRTLTHEEFEFNYERAELPLIEVEVISYYNACLRGLYPGVEKLNPDRPVWTVRDRDYRS